MAIEFLEPWYSSEDAKRSFGGICQRVNEDGASIGLLGTPDAPLLILEDAESVDREPGDIEISIDEAKADWSAVTTSAALLGSRFRIQGKKRERAVLRKHPEAEHPAEKYRRSTSADANKVAEQLEKLVKEVRKLGGKLSRHCNSSIDDLRSIAGCLGQSAALIDRRFREAWRLAQGYSGT